MNRQRIMGFLGEKKERKNGQYFGNNILKPTYCQEKQRLCSLLWAERLCKQTTGQMSAVRTICNRIDRHHRTGFYVPTASTAKQCSSFNFLSTSCLLPVQHAWAALK